MKQITLIFFMLLGMMFSACSSDSSKGDSKYSNLSTEKLMKKAQENDLEAITQLGMNAAYKKNYEEAEKWLRKAAEQDYIVAIHNMGILYSTLENYEAAKEWYKKATNKGYAKSAYNLACIYYQQKSYNEAEKWFRKAKELGDERAESALSQVEQARPQVYTFSGGGINGGMRFDMKYELILNSDRTAEIHSTMNGGYPRTIKASWKKLEDYIWITFSDFDMIFLGRNMMRTKWVYLRNGYIFFDLDEAKANDYEKGTVLNRK